MAITREDSRRFLALGEHLEGGIFQVCVIDLRNAGFKRLREIRLPDFRGPISAVAFSYDSKFVACVSGGVGFLLDWFYEKVFGQENLMSEITRITVNPKDNHTVSTSGPNHWKVWRVEEKIFKEQPMYSKLSQTQHFTDHEWLDDDTLIAVTDMNEAFVQKNNEIVQYIEFSFGREADQTVIAAGATCVIAYSKGFVVASDEGHLALWETSDQGKKDDEEEVQGLYRHSKTWNCGKKQPIVSLAISNREETLGIALKSNDIGTYTFSQVLMVDHPKLHIFCGGFHSGKIQEIDVAVQRPLLATCSNADATLRIWNYHSMTCELAKKLYVVEREEEDPASETVTKPLISIAFHPSGYYLAVGFVDKVRLFHLLYDELRFFREIQVGYAHILRFSKGGHFLAVASGSSLHIFEAYTLRFLHVLEDHSAAINDVLWVSLDKKLVTVGADGGMFEYATNNWTLVSDYKNPTVEFSSVTVGEDILYAVGLEKRESIIFEKETAIQAHRTSVPLQLLLFAHSHFKRPMFVGATPDGRLVNFGRNLTDRVDEMQVHKGAVTSVRASPDGRFIFSAGEDGSIFVFKVEELEDSLHIGQSVLEGKEKDVASRIVDDSLADIVLIRRAQLDKFRETLDSEKRELDKLKFTIDQKLKLRKAQYKDKIREIKKSILENIQSQQARLDEINAQKARQEKDYLNKLHLLEETHNQEVDNLENLYERKLAIEEERFRQLEHDKVEMQQHYEVQIKNINGHYDETKASLEAAFNEAFMKAQNEYESTKKTCDELNRVYESRLLQQEDEHDIEVHDIEEKYFKQLTSLEKDHKELEDQKKTLEHEKKSFNENKQKALNEIEISRLEIKKKQTEIKNLKETTKILELAIKDKEENIIKKENKASEYKGQIRELEESKKVLEDKKKEIQDEMQPKDLEIETIASRLTIVKADLGKEKKDNEKLQRELTNKDDLIKCLRKDNKAQQKATQEVEKIIRNIINEIHYAVSTVDVKFWPDELKKLYQNYVRDDSCKNKKKVDSIKELENQLKYMERSISGIRHSQLKVQESFNNNMRKRTQENSHLIQELNKIKLENKNDEIKIKQLSKNLDTLKRECASAGIDTDKPQAKKIKEANPTPFLNYIKKPTPLDIRLASIQDRQRILDIKSELQDKIEQNVYLKMEINQLKEMIAKVENNR